MVDVGIRELKAKLSEYVQRVAAGETLRVTDRGAPRALLMPLPGGRDDVETGIREGWITPGPAWGTPLPPPPDRVRAQRGATTEQVLSEDRGA